MLAPPRTCDPHDTALRAAVISAELEKPWVLYVLAESVTDQFRGVVSFEGYARQDVPPHVFREMEQIE